MNTSTALNTIHAIPLFADTTDDELQWLIDHSKIVNLNRGDYFMREGDAARQFYVVLEGELQITRTIQGEKQVVGTTPRGIMGGEIWLLSGTKVEATAQAIASTRLMVFDLSAFLGIFTHCPSVGIQILRVAAERMQGIASIVKQQEKMAALGKLAAGLAHELNNPAAAARRSTDMLRELLPHLQSRTIRLNALGMSEQELERLIGILKEAEQCARDATPLSTLEQSEREEELGAWLDDQGIDNSWELAETFVSARLTVDDLTRFAAPLPAAQRSNVLTWLCEAITVITLLNEIEQSTGRISTLVQAIKSYTYMDRGVMQEVDIHRDLDNTLLVLKHRLKNVEVERRYEAELPHLMARGGELNQVWTNLIDNAVDALKGEGKITLITRGENEFVMVEVMDNGPGIPPEVKARIFEPFFTTKEVGAGSGLGLDISYRIIQQHNGTMEVQSQPGQTRFIVRLPIHADKPV